jgi:hypothetical protein
VILAFGIQARRPYGAMTVAIADFDTIGITAKTSLLVCRKLAVVFFCFAIAMSCHNPSPDPQSRFTGRCQREMSSDSMALGSPDHCIRLGVLPDTLARAHRAMIALGEGEPFLIVHYGTDGSGGWRPLDRPLRTLTTLDRFGLVTWKDGTPMLRMLQVPELRRAMGFDDNHRIDIGTRLGASIERAKVRGAWSAKYMWITIP